MPVPRLTATAAVELVERPERGEVALGEVDHVDVVADAGAVGGRVVVAEHHEVVARPTATCITKGIRLFGMPSGSSPMRPLGWAPTGLK